MKFDEDTPWFVHEQETGHQIGFRAANYFAPLRGYCLECDWTEN